MGSMRTRARGATAALVALALTCVVGASADGFMFRERARALDAGATLRKLLGAGRAEAAAPPAPPAPPPTTRERLRASFESAREAAVVAPCAPSAVSGGRAEKCAHVRATEACEGRLKTYLEFAYCADAAGAKTTAWPVAVLILSAVAATYALAVSAGTFYVPALEYVATMMRLTPEAAGVTLLALGNGAPDLYAQVSEISEGELPNLNVVIGSTLGSGLFIATVVLGVVIKASPNPVVINKDVLGVSLGLFALANMSLMLAMCLGKFKTWYTAFFFFAYAGYLSVMAMQDRTQVAADGAKRSDVEEANEQRLEPLFDLAAAKGGPDDIKGSVRPMKTTSKDGDGIIASCTADMNAYEKRLSWVTIPVRVAMAYTMPVVRAGSMDKMYAVILGFMGPMFFFSAPGNDFFVSFGVDESQAMAYNLLASVACCLVVASIVGTKYKAAPLPAATEFASMFAFVQSICWMHLMSDELVLALGALAKIAGVDEEIFGVSFVAWGDGLGDLIACRAVAKAGQVTMAVVACFAGPVFNLLIGLASSIAFLTYMIGDMPYFVKQGELVLSIGCLFTVMFTIAQLTPKSPKEFEMKRSVADTAFGTYAIFLLVYLLCEARVLFAQA